MKNLFGYPLINDVTTTPDKPPRFPGGKPGDYPKANAALQREAYSDLEPKKLAVAPDEAFAQVQAAAETMAGWTITKADKAQRCLVAVARTSLLKFKDDVVVEVRPGEGGGSEIHMRSRSRIGRADFGANAARIREFLEEF